MADTFSARSRGVQHGIKSCTRLPDWSFLTQENIQQYAVFFIGSRDYKWQTLLKICNTEFILSFLQRYNTLSHMTKNLEVLQWSIGYRMLFTIIP